MNINRRGLLILDEQFQLYRDCTEFVMYRKIDVPCPISA